MEGAGIGIWTESVHWDEIKPSSGSDLKTSELLGELEIDMSRGERLTVADADEARCGGC